MKDMLDTIYDAFIEDEVIKKECEDRIKYYIYPETADTSKTFITIRPLEPPVASTHASDKSLSCGFYFQIDVQSHDRKKCKLVQHAIKEVMWKLGFGQQSGGLDEYFEDTKRFVDARRYSTTTNIYDTDY